MCDTTAVATLAQVATDSPADDRKITGSNAKPLDAWLSRVGARLEWTTRGTSVTVECYNLNRQRFIVTRFYGKRKTGWELYLAAGGPSNSVQQTLDAAELRLVVGPAAATPVDAAGKAFANPIQYKGKAAWLTGKQSTGAIDGRPTCEYATPDDTLRCWADVDGVIVEGD